jgi:hypothetical protein
VLAPVLTVEDAVTPNGELEDDQCWNLTSMSSLGSHTCDIVDYP